MVVLARTCTNVHERVAERLWAAHRSAVAGFLIGVVRRLLVGHFSEVGGRHKIRDHKANDDEQHDAPTCGLV